MPQEEIHAEMAATVLSLQSASGSRVDDGDVLLLLESMKMEIPVVAEGSGIVVHYAVAPGSTVCEGDLMVVIEHDSPRTG